MNIRNYFLAALAASSIALTGCNDTEEDNNPTFNWDITEANAKNIVSKVYSFNDPEGDMFLLNSNDPGLKSAFNQKAIQQLTYTSTCPGSGSLALSNTYDDTAPFTDFTLSFELLNCDFNDGTGPANGYFSISSSSDSLTGDLIGSIDIDLTSQGFTILGDIDSTIDGNNYSNSTSFALSISTTEGSVSAETNSLFVTYFSDLYPSTGSMTITGPLGSKIYVTAMGDYVQIEVDLGGNGSIEDTQTYLWTEL